MGQKRRITRQTCVADDTRRQGVMYGLSGSFLAHFCVARMHARSHSVRFGRFCKGDGNAGSKRKRANMSKVSDVGEAGNPHA